jgi:predicted SprT family Zn-dependent metalloprotease
MRELNRQIRGWIETSHGWFRSYQIDEELGITEKKDKVLRRMLTKRLCDRGVLQHHPTLKGAFRYLRPQKRIILFEEKPVTKRNLLHCPNCGKRVNLNSWVKRDVTGTIYFCKTCQRKFLQ